MRDRVYITSPPKFDHSQSESPRRVSFRSPCRGGRNTSNNRVYSDTRAVRARDSISGRQGSLTPACGTAWPRRLYYDVYGLIRDILEMSRVHARRVTRRREMRRERLRSEEGSRVRGRRRRRHGGCKDRRAVARGEWVIAVTCITPSPFISPIPPSFLCPPFPPRLRRQHGSIVRGSINWVSTARPLVPLVLRRYERSSCYLIIKLISIC